VLAAPFEAQGKRALEESDQDAHPERRTGARDLSEVWSISSRYKAQTQREKAPGPPHNTRGALGYKGRTHPSEGVGHL
jgi:hypothetical protein